MPVDFAVQKGLAVAADPKNVMVRLHGMMLTALEVADPRVVGWMPAHLTYADLKHGMAKKSDGTRVTEADLEANGLADKLAKRRSRAPPGAKRGSGEMG